MLRSVEEQLVCPNCQRAVDKHWRYCAYCHTQIKKDCPSCDNLLELGWSLCPYCGSEASQPKMRTREELPTPSTTARPAKTGEIQVSDLPVVE